MTVDTGAGGEDDRKTVPVPRARRAPVALALVAAAFLAGALFYILQSRGRPGALPPAAPARPAAGSGQPTPAPPAALVVLRDGHEPYPEHGFDLKPPLRPWVEMPPVDVRTVIGYARTEPALGFAVIVEKNKQGLTAQQWSGELARSIPGATSKLFATDGADGAELSFHGELQGAQRAVRLRVFTRAGRLYQVLAWSAVADEGILDAAAPLLFSGFRLQPEPRAR